MYKVMWLIGAVVIPIIICLISRKFYKGTINSENNFIESTFLLEVFLNDKTLEQFVKKNLDWYIRKSEFYKWIYRTLSIIHLFIIASTPVVAIVFKGEPLRVAIMAAISTLLYGILSFLNPRDKWKRYRGTAERIKTEVMLFYNSQENNLDNSQKKSEFVKLLCEICLEENNKWIKEDKVTVKSDLNDF